MVLHTLEASFISPSPSSMWTIQTNRPDVSTPKRPLVSFLSAHVLRTFLWRRHNEDEDVSSKHLQIRRDLRRYIEKGMDQEFRDCGCSGGKPFQQSRGCLEIDRIDMRLQTIKCLLIHPNPESALDEEAGKLLLEDYQEYARVSIIPCILDIRAGSDHSLKYLIRWQSL
jgi:hypothetical protein